MYAAYGISNAGLVLQKILADPKHKKAKKRIGSLINDLHRTMDFLYTCPDRGMYTNLYCLIKKEFVRRVNHLDLPINIHTHLHSTVAGLLIQKQREYLINRGGLSDKQKAKVRQRYSDYYNEFQKRIKKL